MNGLSAIHIAATAAAVDDEDCWVTAPLTKHNPLHRSLRDFEQQMRCPVCHEFFHAPVSVQPCLHTFCSECIRNSLKAGLQSIKRQAICPVCREQVATRGADFNVVANRTVEVLVSNFQGLRPALRQGLVAVTASTRSAGSSCAVGEARPAEDAATRSPDPRRSTRASYKQDVDQDNGDEHDHDCSQENDSEDVEVVEQARLKKKRRCNYMGLKKKQLSKLCADEGLSDAGTDSDMKARHEAFVTLYNSECDSFQPRPVQALVQEIHRREQARRDERRQLERGSARIHGRCIDQLMVQRKQLGEATATTTSAPTAALTSGNANFDAEVNHNFTKMVARLRQAKTTNEKSTSSEETKKDPEEIAPETLPAKPAAMEMGGVAALQAVVSEDSPLNSSNSKQASTSSHKMRGVAYNEFAADSLSAGTVRAYDLQLSSDSVPKRKTAPNTERPFRPRQKKVSAVGAYTKALTNSTRRQSNQGSIVGPWECHSCTLINEKNTWSNAACEVCGTKRNPEPNAVANTVSIDF